MSSGAWSFLGFIGTLLIQGFIGAYVYGQLAERVKGLRYDHNRLVEKVDGHGQRLNAHGERIAALEGKK